MPYVQYKAESGALHIGGGRFFYAGKPEKVTVKEKDELVAAYTDLEEVADLKTKNESAAEPSNPEGE